MIQKEFIRNELRYRYPDVTDHIAHPHQNVGRPLLFEGGARKFGARIIIALATEINALVSEQQDETLFIVIGSPRDEVVAGFDVCVLPANEQTSAVFNFVQRLFDRLDDWTQSLRQAAETGEGVEELLVRASGMLQNPVFLLDERGHIVASSEPGVPSASIFIAQTESLSQMDDADARVSTLRRTGAPDALVATFRSGNQSFSLLCPSSERALYSSDEIVFDSLAGFLRLMLSERTLGLGAQRKQRENEEAAAIFRALLSQQMPEREANDALARLEWSGEDDYAMLAIEPANGVLRAADADAICDQIETELEGACAFAQLPVVIAIVRTDFLKQPAFLASLKSIANERAFIFGVCEAYPGFSELLQRKEMATRALDHAKQIGGVATYSDFFEEELAANAIAAFPQTLVCLRSVLAIARYDRAHETNYLETAEQYVKNRFNAVRTAGELFIHRSTFLYRLERMREQFGLDLDDAKLSLLHLLYSFRVVQSER